ncbi:MAG: hypothetical protein AAF725_03315 [Acidobacteriota bacterium]
MKQQVNLSRFSLFFPEKREFFLENSGIFEFGPNLGSALKVFFSRRIGLSAGRQVDLEYGARLAGRAGPWSLGLLGVRTGSLEAREGDPESAVARNDWGTVRVKRNLGERSNLGLIVTHRDDADLGTNRVYGVDGEWKPSDSVGFWGFAAASEGPSEESEGWAGGLGGEYRGSYWSGGARVFEIEDGFDPQLGFVRRGGGRRYSSEVEYEPRPDWEGVRNLSFEVEADLFEIGGVTESYEVNVDFFGVDFLSGESVVMWFNDLGERLFEPFEIFSDVTIASGSYGWNEVGLWGRTNTGRELAVEGWVQTGGFYDGDRLAHNLTVTYRPSPYFRSRTTWSRNDIRLPAGDFETNLWRQRLSVSVHTDMTVDALLQYSDAAEQVSANLRFNWHYRPGSDLFVVYNHGWDAPTFSDLAGRERQLVVKVTYSWDA